MSYLRMYEGPKAEKANRKQQRQQQEEKTNVRQLRESATTLPHEPASQAKLPIPVKNKDRPLSTYIIYLAVSFMTVVELGMYLINGYMEVTSDLPQWIATANKIIPIARNAGAFIAMLALPAIGGRIAWTIYIFLICVSLLNNLQWTHRTGINATIERTNQRQAELEAKYGLSTLKQRYEDAKADETKAKADREAICKPNDGTKCQRQTQVIQASIKRSEQAWTSYSDAQSKVDTQAKAESLPIASNPSLLINTILPLIGGILIRLVSRS